MLVTAVSSNLVGPYPVSLLTWGCPAAWSESAGPGLQLLPQTSPLQLPEALWGDSQLR